MYGERVAALRGPEGCVSTQMGVGIGNNLPREMDEAGIIIHF